MKKCLNCNSPAEAERYKFCYDCWWKQDPRNKKKDMIESLQELMSDLEKKQENKDSGPQPGPKPAPMAVNGRVIVETYKEDRGLKTTVSNGFAMVQQKVQVVGLKALADARIADGTKYGEHISQGDTVYIKEGSLQSAPWAKASFTSDAIEGAFMIVDAAHIEFVVRK